jgi:hypothetical protein
MKEYRSGSQILFGYLPEQTVDLAGRIWKVKQWRSALPRSFDDKTIRDALIRAADDWANRDADGGYAAELRSGRELSVVALNFEEGVDVVLYPQVWVCRSCRLLGPGSPGTCASCGSTQWSQFPFVGYHECGALREPFAARCPTHGLAHVEYPSTRSAREIKFHCPHCSWTQEGLGFVGCQCGHGVVSWGVPRAASVYTPWNVVVVNPPNPTVVQAMRAAGGGARALDWILEGMRTNRPNEGRVSRSSLVEDLMRKGFSQALAEQMTDVAVNSGQVVPEDSGGDHLSEKARATAEQQAMEIALATDQSRLSVARLLSSSTGSARERLYAEDYPLAMVRAGLESVDLVDKFPVLTGMFAYTRGEPKKTFLRPFKGSGGTFRVYADTADTEALLVRLSPTRVARWLNRRGHSLPSSALEDDRAARLAIVELATWGDGIQRSDVPAVSSEIYTLVHSYAHRFVRRAATFSGIERSSLNEYLVPWHLAFFVYGAPRGNFVLGGLQAVFESDLHLLLRDVVDGEHRCPLDPGCSRSGGACLACLHLGETSCRGFNTHLDRRTLFGQHGFLTRAVAPIAAPQVGV